jgi:hypothetical protein
MSKMGDTMSGGAGVDTLDVNFAAVLGGINVDLSSTTNQIVSANGSTIAGSVLGFENVDLSGYSGSFGAMVTASAAGSSITGTPQTDQLNGGAKADIITAATGTGDDDVTATGAGNDTVIISQASLADTDQAGNNATWDLGGGTGDIISVGAGAIADADMAAFSNVEILTLGGAGTVVLGSNADTSGIVKINMSAGNNDITPNLGVTHIYTSAGANGSDEISPLATASGLTIDDTAAQTVDIVLDLTAFQDSAADWGTAEASAAAVNGADKWHYATGVLTVYNQNKSGGAGAETLNFVGINAVADNAANGKMTIDVAA